MYRDHKGFVYYKGNQVEHYSGTWAYTLDAMHSLRNLQRRCRFLEKKGMEIDMKTTVWEWYKYQPAFAAATIRELQVSTEKQGGFRFTNVLIREPLRGDWEEGFLFPGHVGEEDIWKTERIQDFGSPGSSLLLIKPTLIAPVYMTFGTDPERNATEEEILLSSACFQELLRQGLLSILKQNKADHPINVYLHNPIYWRLEEDRETYFCQGHRFCTYEEVIAGIEDGTVKRTHG